MTTIATLLNELELELLSHYSPPLYDIPASGFSTADTTVQLTSIDVIGQGALLECGFEMMYVTGWNEGTRTATVIRGHLGSTARSGSSSDVVRINPRVPQISMLYALRDELRSWDDRLFTVEQEAVTFTSSYASAEATPTRDPYRVVSARPRAVNAADQRRTIPLELRRAEATSEFASGYSLHMPPGMVFQNDTIVDVVYALPFDLSTLSTTTDLETTVGLATTMLEILKLGILARVTAGKGVGRLDTFGTMRADIQQTVPGTLPLQASAQYKEMRDNAYDAEVRRLLSRYSWRTAA